MDLILWRHAEAEDGMPDSARRLTPRGHKQAARVAAWLLHRLPAKFSVVASPAERTRQTAQALGVPVRTVAGLAPGGSVAGVLRATDWPNGDRAVVVVGHQPTLGEVAAFLVTGAAAGWSVKKGGLWWLTNRLRDDASKVVVRAVISPDLL